MNKLIVVLALFASSAAMAEIPAYECSFGELESVLTIDDSGYIYSADLTAKQANIIETVFDSTFDCNEGVELTGVKVINGQVYQTAICWADSLGSMPVKLAMSCEDTEVQ